MIVFADKQFLVGYGEVHKCIDWLMYRMYEMRLGYSEQRGLLKDNVVGTICLSYVLLFAVHNCFWNETALKRKTLSWDVFIASINFQVFFLFRVSDWKCLVLWQMHTKSFSTFTLKGGGLFSWKIIVRKTRTILIKITK